MLQEAISLVTYNLRRFASCIKNIPGVSRQTLKRNRKWHHVSNVRAWKQGFGLAWVVENLPTRKVSLSRLPLLVQNANIILNIPYILYSPALLPFTYILLELMITAFVAQLAKRRTRFAGSRVRFSPKALELHFSQLMSLRKFNHSQNILIAYLYIYKFIRHQVRGDIIN